MKTIYKALIAVIITFIPLLAFSQNYYVAGNGTSGSIWCDGKSWNPSGSPMENGTITFENVPAGNDYQFKITTGSWNPSWGSANIDAEHSNVTLSDAGGNVKFSLAQASDVTISFDGSKISVVVTPIASAPLVTANAASDIANTSAKLHATITSKGSNDITEYGFYYATATGVSETSTKIQVATTNPTSFPHDYSFDLTGLQEATTYYYKAYATNAQGTTLSDDELSFTTKGLFVAGNGTVAGSEGKWCNGADWSTTASPMTNGSITFEKVPVGNDYRFVVTNGAWHTEAGGADWGYDDLKENGSNIELSNADGNIQFALNSVSDVTISIDENSKISVNIKTIQLEADVKQVALNTPITLTPSAIGGANINAVSYSVKILDAINWTSCSSTYIPTTAGIYTFKAEVDGFTSNEVQVTVCPEVKVYVHIPTDIWTNPTTVSLYNWDINTPGSFVGATALGDNWYSYTFDKLYDFGIIVVNGTAFSSNENQTVNINNIEENNSLFRVGHSAYVDGSPDYGKKTVTQLTPSIEFTNIPLSVSLGSTITFTPTIKDAPAIFPIKVERQTGTDTWEELTVTDGSYSYKSTEAGTCTFRASIIINGNTYTSITTVNVVSYYLAGEGFPGITWDANSIELVNGSKTFQSLAAGTYKFKITDGKWHDQGGTEYDSDDLDTDNSSADINLGAADGTTNIQFTLSVPSDVTITFDGTNICVKAEQVERYRLLSTLADGSTTYVSNEASHNDDIMSVYTQSAGSLQLQRMVNGEWQNVEGAVVSYTENNVIVAPLVLADDGTASIGTVSNYTGNYYIRTPLAPGGKDNYKQDGNKFTYFEANRTFNNETYNHYWVIHTKSNANDASIANDYNSSLAMEIPKQDNSIDNLDHGVSVRYSYDNTTNLFERTFLQGSSVDNYLYFYGSNIYDGNNVITESAYKTFNDISNWVYEYDLQADPDATITIKAKEEVLVDNEIILDGGSTIGSDKYDLRVIYDFKKNRWIASWLPNLSNMTISGGKEIHVDANMMLVRNHNNKVNSFNITDADSYIDQIQHIYFVMELERDTLFNGDGSKKFSHLFWFSLPYSCKISEIFGIEGYKKKWVIQRYRGDLRAEKSWTTNIETFWANMNSTATLEPNRGYVLALNLTKEDFQDIGGKSVLRLYFPSVEQNFTLSQSTINMTVTVPEHECNVNGRDSVDSHWNVIGIPGFQPVNMKKYTEQNGFNGFAGNKAPNFLYEWKGTHDVYEVVDGTSITYQHFYSYMVQFAGTIDWGQFTQGTPETTPAAVRAQRSQQAYRQDTYRINLIGEDAEDRTFIRLSTDGTEGYVINQDLEKINNSQLAQIYTLGAGTRLAANTLPRETQTVTLGLNIPANGTYTLSLDENGQSVTAILYDKWENVYTDLSRDSYEFTQMEGRCEDRFEIQFSSGPTVPTDMEEANAAFIRLDGRTLRIVGGNEGENVAIYDMAGRCLLRTHLNADFCFEAPVSGVYVLDFQGKKQKVVIK